MICLQYQNPIPRRDYLTYNAVARDLVAFRQLLLTPGVIEWTNACYFSGNLSFAKCIVRFTRSLIFWKDVVLVFKLFFISMLLGFPIELHDTLKDVCEQHGTIIGPNDRIDFAHVGILINATDVNPGYESMKFQTLCIIGKNTNDYRSILFLFIYSVSYFIGIEFFFVESSFIGSATALVLVSEGHSAIIDTPPSRAKTKDLFINLSFDYSKVFTVKGENSSSGRLNQDRKKGKKLTLERTLNVALIPWSTFLQVKTAIPCMLSLNFESRGE